MGWKRFALGALLMATWVAPANAAITLAPSTLPAATVGLPYEQPLTASGGIAPYSFAITAGGLPAGMAMDGDGIIDSTPAEAGTFAFTVTATDVQGQTGAQSYELVVVPPQITVSPAALPDATVGIDYEVLFSASGGTAPYTFDAPSGSLPPGLFLSSDGVMNGAPTAPGTYSFSVTAIDNYNQAATKSYALVVRSATITLAPTTLPDGIVGVPYEQPLSATGGTGPYSFAITAGALPAGMAMDGDGIIDSTPAEAGTFAFTVTATDAFGQAGEQSYTLVVAPPRITVSPGTLPDATVGIAYEMVFSASGGTAPYTFDVPSGALPPGLSFSSDGTLAGAPQVQGSFGFTITATDSFNQAGVRNYTLEVAGATIVLTPASLPDGRVGTAYEAPIGASGGTAPYSFAVVAGALPAGMGMDGDGIVDGTPEEAGSFAFTIAATDSFGQVGEHAYALHVLAPVIALSPASLPDGTVGVDYPQLITASGGNAPYTFALTAGSLPPGLSLSSDGAIDGAPEQAGHFAFTVTATDNYQQTGAQAYEVTVANAAITLSPGLLASATVGEPYEQRIHASGGTAPYTFAVTAGALPPGMALGTEGILEGTPEAEGAFAFSVTATDAYDQEGVHEYAFTVSAPPLPDPTSDPTVVGLLTSQVSTVRTFAISQIGNVHHRLEALHGGGDTGWSFWIAGSVRSGDRDGTGNVSPLSFETSGLTGGSDYRLNQQFAFGGGLGYARDRSAIGRDGSRNEGDAPSGVSYMSWHPEDMPFFLDGMGGYQDLEFDVRRVTEGGGTFLSRRLGKQRFTSWQGGYEYRSDTFLFSPYGRLDAASARLDGFREQGDDPLALQFGSQDVDLRTTTLGFRMHYRMETDWGEWEPRLRVEYQRDFHDDDGVSIRYANQAASPVFFTTPMGLDEDRVVLELGSIFRTTWHGLLVRVDYLGVYGGANDNEHGVTFSFQED